MLRCKITVNITGIQCLIFLYKQFLYFINLSLSIWHWGISKAFKKYTLVYIRNSNLESRAWEISFRNYEPHIIQWNGLQRKQRQILWWKQLFYRKGMSDQSGYFLHLWSVIKFCQRMSAFMGPGKKWKNKDSS